MELFREAFTIMVLGMALVFAFLAGVILAVNVAAGVIRRVKGPPGDESEGEPSEPAGDGRRAAAIAVALHRFRTKE